MYDYEQERADRVAAEKKRIRSLIKWISGGILAAIVLIGGLITFFNSYDVVEGGHAGVGYSLNGGIQEKPYPQGWQWHSPFTNMLQYPTSKETVTLKKGKEKEPDNSFAVNTADGKSVNVDVTYNYAFHEDKLPYIANRFRKATANAIEQTFINLQLKGAIQSVTTQYSVVEVYGGEKRGEITAKIQDAFKKAMIADGIEVDNFSFLDIRPDEATLASIQKITDAKSAEELLKQQSKNLQQEQVNEELKAQTAKKVAIVQSEQAAEQVRIAAEAEANRVKIAADAQAEANAKLSASLTDKILQDKMIASLPNIKFPQFYGSNSSIFNLPADLLKSATATPAK